jgi:hypothetical protein
MAIKPVVLTVDDTPSQGSGSGAIIRVHKRKRAGAPFLKVEM